MSHAPTASPSDHHPSQGLSKQPALLTRRVDGPAGGDHASPLYREVATILLDDAVEDPARQVADCIKQSIGHDILLAGYDPLSKRFTLLADSRGIESPSRLSLGDPIEQALSEARLLQRNLTSASDGKTTTPAAQQLASYFGSSCTSVFLLRDCGNEIQGAVIVVGDSSAAPDQFLNQLTAPLAKYLRLNRAANYSTLQRMRHAFAGYIASNRFRCSLLCLAIFTVAMFVPVPFKVKAVCQCEPTGKRIVAAPFEGQLLSSYVKPGDSVVAGELIAVMDGKELRSQIAASEATLQQARQRHSSAVATSDASSASKELLEIERLRQQLAIFLQREQRLQLLSPIDGIVVSGDLEEAEGATLVIGQGLFEIAPLDKLTAEIAVDESDIQNIEADQEATLAFDGDFGRRYTARVQRVHPRAEVKDNKNVFIVEAVIDGADANLAPGMQGQAKVQCGWRPLGWVFFHKPYIACCRFWGWY